MKKLQEINLLVEEAIKELRSADVKIEVRKILNKLARKCAEINNNDLVFCCSGSMNTYNSRLRDGQVETPETKQEEKPALQPLPKALPDFMLHYNRSELSSLQLWEKICQHFGTQPREWWMDLKKGDKFVYKKDVCTFDGRIAIGDVDYRTFNLEDCSPYTDPTQSFREKLTPEMQVEFDKLMEGVGK